MLNIKQIFKPILLPVWLRWQRSHLWYKYTDHLRNIKTNKYPRKIQAFCVGLPKTGTHSIARMVHCRSAHEPETHTLLYLYNLYIKGKISKDDQVRVLKARDSWLWLELESNWMLGLVIDALIEAFPNAKFIYTVRNPEEWIGSEINQEYIIKTLSHTEEHLS